MKKTTQNKTKIDLIGTCQRKAYGCPVHRILKYNYNKSIR